MRYAIVEAMGHQYRVAPKEYLEVDRLPYDVGDEVELERVLLVVDGDRVHVGTPTVPGARVRAVVVEHFKGPKILVFKYKPRKRYRRRLGYRHRYTRLLVKDILLEGETPSSEEAVAEPAASEAQT